MVMTKPDRPTAAVAATGDATLQYGAMPDTSAVNYYDADPYLRFLLKRHLTPDELASGEPQLRALGARLGNEIESLAAEADRQTPTLTQRDKRGERIDEIQPSRAYRALERIFYGEFALHALSLRPPIPYAGDNAQPTSLVFNDALIYLAEQVESGLFCPLSMTRALTRTLLKFAPADVIAEYLPHLLSTNLDTLNTGAMFMTEKQGGSDLGQTATTARPSPDRDGWWELTGEKWFCSNVAADLILTLARPEGAGPGTRGLGLFLIPRRLPDGSRNPYRIERLKDKLGVRSFASGEVTFTGTLARCIGGPGEGWLQMTEMLNVTRLGCASAAAALARRSFLEALTHARGRVAFGAPLADLPLMREQLLDMLLDVEALTALFFEGSAQLAAADAGNPEARTLSRVLIPLAKYHVSEESRRVVAEGMEVRGGNAYIEDWPNARLLRDVHVQAIWEGTGNISALDVGRALLRDNAGDVLLANLRHRLSQTNDPAVARAARLVERATIPIEQTLHRLPALTPAERDLLMKRITRQLARIVTATLLVEDAAIQAAEDANYRCLVQAVRYLRRHLYPPRDGLAAELDRLPLDAFDAII
ncbi:MAG: acyl-CoA dehydrogenase family protein, partial [Ktedonobacterales bacterium]